MEKNDTEARERRPVVRPGVQAGPAVGINEAMGRLLMGDEWEQQRIRTRAEHEATTEHMATIRRQAEQEAKARAVIWQLAAMVAFAAALCACVALVAVTVRFVV